MVVFDEYVILVRKRHLRWMLHPRRIGSLGGVIAVTGMGGVRPCPSSNSDIHGYCRCDDSADYRDYDDRYKPHRSSNTQDRR